MVGKRIERSIYLKTGTTEEQAKPIVTKLKGQFIVCPDNGLITWPWRRLGPGESHQISNWPASASNTFHGRDILAPVAGMLADGQPLKAVAKPIDDPILLNIPLQLIAYQVAQGLGRDVDQPRNLAKSVTVE